MLRATSVRPSGLEEAYTNGAELPDPARPVRPVGVVGEPRSWNSWRELLSAIQLSMCGTHLMRQRGRSRTPRGGEAGAPGLDLWGH
jgi:hypothetical protein